MKADAYGAMGKEMSASELDAMAADLRQLTWEPEAIKLAALLTRLADRDRKVKTVAMSADDIETAKQVADFLCRAHNHQNKGEKRKC